MTFSEFGLVNTRKMFADALVHGYAIPAFNFFNMETLTAIITAARDTHSPLILAASTSAINYMTPDMVMGMIRGANIKPNEQIALHLDHGGSVADCMAAIKIGFSSVMIDASKLPITKNIEITRSVVEYAHQFDVTVEAELGIISGIEDENTFAQKSHYTNPDDVVRFIKSTGVDSLAIAIGTSHGAYKNATDTAELRFDILSEIANRLPDFPLVLHGASSVPQKVIGDINKFGGHINGAHGIPADQLRRAATTNICKINVDSDTRLAFTAGIREALAIAPDNFNPRQYLIAARDNVTQNCIAEIINIMGSENRI